MSILGSLYWKMRNSSYLNMFKKIDDILRKILGSHYQTTINKLKRRIRCGGTNQSFLNMKSSKYTFQDLLWNYDEKSPLIENYKPKVSVIVPNYNHELYLRERLDSIYHQTYENFEVILLDDCSKDNSRTVLEEYQKKYHKNTKILFNDENVGIVFKQWEKGIEAASGELIWIAESDDYCEKNFLEVMVEKFKYESVNLAFARSIFMTNGIETWNTEEYLYNIHGFKWDTPFTMSSNLMVSQAFVIKNIIPNVSSAVFRRPEIIPKELKEMCSSMKLSSDWIFYLWLMRGGCVSYTNETTNYYRIHENSTSLNVQTTSRYYKEYEMVSEYIAKNYDIDTTVFESIEKDLLMHYRDLSKTEDTEIVKENYRVDYLKEIAKKRTLNVIMACFSLQSGGGETYPLYLANELYRQGITVTVLDFHLEKTQKDIRELLIKGIPIIRIKYSSDIGNVLTHLNADVIHSHHASIDEILGQWIGNNEFKTKQVITLHGMYEALWEDTKRILIDTVMKSCSHFVYIADKNLEVFKDNGVEDLTSFEKIPNGLPIIETHPVDREELQIGKDAFVLCLVSRGIPEKGWAEGMEAVKRARESSGKDIHLVIIGDGEMKEKLEKNAPSYIHFMGIRKNVRDYYAMSDMGFLPTRFQGESYPLVVIESLQCGKPVLATDIAEVRAQLTDHQGNLAGDLFTFKDGALDINEVAEKIAEYASNKEKYQLVKQRCKSASEKFDISKVAERYLEVYKE